MSKLQKNYGEIQSESGVKRDNSELQYFFDQIPENLAKEHAQQISKCFRDFPKSFDFSNLLHLTKENAKAWKEINLPDISIPWVTPDGALLRKYYDVEPIEYSENDLLSPTSPYRTVISEIGEIMLDELNDHALKTVVFEQGGDLYVGIKEWSKDSPEEAWQEGTGIEIDPAQLCLLAEHLNRAIQLIFLETKAPESEVESK